MRFVWQHIEFEDGSNPYICKTEAEFKRIQAKYCLKLIKCNFWIAKAQTFMTNKEIIEKAISEIIERGNNPYYPMDQHFEDMDLIADLTELKMKYKEVV